jgi:Amt family ammonium transporter
VFGVIWVEKIGIDDPIGAVAVHGMSGVWGTLACGLFAVPALATKLATGDPAGGLVYSGHFTQLKVQAVGLVVVGVFTFTMSFVALKVMDMIWGIRVDPIVESQGLDVHEHGMWGYPEFYIPVPGGYGTESHGHVGAHAPVAPVHATVAPTEASPLPASSEG